MPVPQDGFEDILAEALDAVDRMLAEEGVLLRSRPLLAAKEFVRHCVLEVQTDRNIEPTAPGTFLEYMDSEWFRIVYARTVAWYREQYGSAMDEKSDRSAIACVLVRGTPFRMTVPLVTSRPGTPGETIWIHYPDRVETAEDALAWIDRAPNFATLSSGDGMKARRLADAVAGSLRSIHCGLATIGARDRRVGELRDPILPHLEQAAAQIASATPIEIRRAQWELQMACELSLKMLSQQRGGTFTETHDLHVLHDRLPPGRAPFARRLLSKIPNWSDMAEWRYGGGKPIGVAVAFSRYRAALEIVEGVVAAAYRKYRIHGASFEIRRAPFLHCDLDMFKPRERLG